MSRLRAAASALLGRAGTPLAVTAPASLLEHRRRGSAPLAPGGAEAAAAPALDVAVVVPSFRRGSGGHQATAEIVRGLETRGHRCSVWISDEEGRHGGQPATRVAASFADFFGPAIDGPVRLGFDGWRPVDVAVAVGWQTVPRVLLLDDVKSRAYLVLDHEPEFYATSAEREWAAWSYGQGLHAIAASRWLAELIGDRYGATVGAFEFGIDHIVYRPLDLPRRDDRVLFYARAVTARRAVPLGLLALAELQRRRPDVELALFGESRPLDGVRAENLGVLTPDALARAYAEATVGVVLSMTNPSLIGPEMLACGLPVVELDAPAMRAGFGADGPLLLAALDPIALADAIEGLLDDPARRDRRAARGLEFAAGRTWSAAVDRIEAELRAALSRAG